MERGGGRGAGEEVEGGGGEGCLINDARNKLMTKGVTITRGGWRREY